MTSSEPTVSNGNIWTPAVKTKKTFNFHPKLIIAMGVLIAMAFSVGFVFTITPVGAVPGESANVFKWDNSPVSSLALLAVVLIPILAAFAIATTFLISDKPKNVNSIIAFGSLAVSSISGIAVGTLIALALLTFGPYDWSGAAKEKAVISWLQEEHGFTVENKRFELPEEDKPVSFVLKGDGFSEVGTLSSNNSGDELTLQVGN